MSSERKPAATVGAAAFAAPRRLHIAAAAVSAVLALRGAALPILAAVFVGGSGGGAGRAVVFALAGAALSLAAGVVSWRSTSYQLAGGALHFRTGVLSPDDTAVPIGRIQAIDTVQGPVQRLFGAVELHVQTPGGEADGDVVLTAVSPGDARALRAALGHAEPKAPAARLRLGGRRLLLTALTAPQFGMVLPAVGGLLAGADAVLSNATERGIVTRVDSLASAAAAALVIVAATFVLSFGGALAAFAGFEVERDGDRLRIRRGLVQRRAASVPVARIDAVAVVEGLLRAPFGLATLRLETAGYRRRSAAARTLFPLVRTRDVPALLAQLVPGLHGEEARAEPTTGDAGASDAAREAGDAGASDAARAAGDAGASDAAREAGGAGARDAGALRRPPPRAARRYVRRPALAGAALGVALLWAVPPLWPALPALVAMGAAQGIAGFRAAGLRLEPTRVVLRSRRVARVTLVARRHRLQELSVARSPLQRRAGLATFGLALGSGRRGRVRHLEAAQADAALAAL